VFVERTYDYHDYSVRPGHRWLRMPLDRRAVRALKRRGNARLRIKLASRDRTGRYTRKRKITLHLRRPS